MPGVRDPPPKPLDTKASPKRANDAQEWQPLDLAKGNIMFNPRVVRGTTVQKARPASQPAPPPKKARKVPKAPVSLPPPTPEPVEGRAHMSLQTETYLEELTDVLPEDDAGTQTDPLLDRPASPLFVPAKAGLDATTQIEPGDLFDFDFEVEPLLEVLVGQVLQQAVRELREEHELAALAAREAHFQQVRSAELAAVQRLEAAEKRRGAERERRLAEARAAAAAREAMRRKVIATSFARAFMKGLTRSVFASLERRGVFYDPVQREVETVVLPALRRRAAEAAEKARTAKAVAAAIVRAALALLQEQAAAGEAERRAEVAAEAAAAQQAEAERTAAEAAELEGWRGRAPQVLALLVPEAVPEARAAAVREGLQAEADAAALARWTAEQEAAAARRAAAAQEAAARRAATAQAAAEARARAREERRAARAAAAAASAEGAAEGEEGAKPEPEAEPEADAEPEAEAEPAAEEGEAEKDGAEGAEEATPPAPVPVEDALVLVKLLENEMVSREAVRKAEAAAKAAAEEAARVAAAEAAEAAAEGQGGEEE